MGRMTHGAGAHIPIELQNRSMVVQGEIRMLTEEPCVSGGFHIRTIRADVRDHVVNEWLSRLGT